MVSWQRSDDHAEGLAAGNVRSVHPSDGVYIFNVLGVEALRALIEWMIQFSLRRQSAVPYLVIRFVA